MRENRKCMWLALTIRLHFIYVHFVSVSGKFAPLQFGRSVMLSPELFYRAMLAQSAVI